MEALYLLGGFFGLVALFALIDAVHSRWAWRQSEREVSAMMGQRPQRKSGPGQPVCNGCPWPGKRGSCSYCARTKGVNELDGGRNA